MSTWACCGNWYGNDKSNCPACGWARTSVETMARGSPTEELDRLIDAYGDAMMKVVGLRGSAYVEAREEAIVARNALRDFITDDGQVAP